MLYIRVRVRVRVESNGTAAHGSAAVRVVRLRLRLRMTSQAHRLVVVVVVAVCTPKPVWLRARRADWIGSNALRSALDCFGITLFTLNCLASNGRYSTDIQYITYVQYLQNTLLSPFNLIAQTRN